VQQGPRDSIRRRLSITVLATTVTALLVTSIAILALELSRFRDDLSRAAALEADVVGMSSVVGLIFHDPSPVEAALGSLAADPDVLAAAVYDAEGQIFARYRREGTPEVDWPAVRPPGHAFEGNRLEIFRDVRSEGERIGAIHLRVDASAVGQRMASYALIVIVALAGAALVAVLSARRLQQSVSVPLASLARGAAALAAGDLSVVVEVDRRDEIGALADAFNRMAVGLRDLVARVRSDAREVSGVSAVVSDSSGSLFEQVQRQEEAVGESRDSVERMSVAVGEVAANVESLSSTATETSSSVIEMDASISEIAGHIEVLAQTIEEATSAVSEMTVSISEVSRNASILDEATGATARLLKQMMTSVGRVEENARRCQSSSERAREEASVGTSSVEGVVAGMGEIQSSFRDLETAASQLAARSQSIGEVVQVIEGVVSQTSLLALNASIIAAQAGEHGRAFAVVAQEVQGLAETTSTSTREIESIVKAVQHDIDTAVGAVRRGSTRVERGAEMSRTAGNVLRGLEASAQESAQMVGEIVEAASRQEEDIRQLDLAMVEVKNLVAQIAQATREQNNASAEITRGVDRVRALGDDVRRSTGEQSRQSRVITSSVEEVAARIGQIARSAGELRDESRRIQHAIGIFRDVSEQSTARAEQLRSVVETLSTRAAALDSEVDRFVLEKSS